MEAASTERKGIVMGGSRVLSGSLLALVLVWGLSASSLSAGLVTLQEQSLTDLLGSSPQALGSLLETDMSAGNLVSVAYSRAYTDGEGLYAYLYQVDNTGEAGRSPVEMFTLWPFLVGDDPMEMGYLSGTIPSEFLSGGETPEAEGYAEDIGAGMEVSFYYTKKAGKQIVAGEHSVVMYALSAYAPDQILGNVIDGSVGSGPVVGPVPEPATLSLLVLAGLAALGRKRKS